MSISRRVVHPIPPGATAALLAAGLSALLLAHPAFCQRRSIYTLMAGAVALVWLLALAHPAARRRAWPPAAMGWPGLAFEVSALLSVALNADAAWTPLFLPASQWLLLWAGWWMSAGRDALRLWGGALLAGGAAAGLYALAQYGHLDPLPPATPFAGRIVSFFANPNHLGSYAACILPLSLAGFLRAPGRRLGWYLLVLLPYAALLLAASRGGWWAGWGGCILVMGGFVWRARQGRLCWRPGAVGTLLALLAATTLLLGRRPLVEGRQGPISMGERLFSSANIIGPGSKRDSTINHRYFIWNLTWEMIRSAPFFGLGYGSYQRHFAHFREASRNQARFQRLEWHQRREITPYAHNEYLHLWAEGGIFHLLSFVWLVGAGLRQSLKGLEEAGRETLFLWAGWGGLSVVLIHSLVSYPLHLPLSGAIFWILLGIIFNGKSWLLHGDEECAKIYN